MGTGLTGDEGIPYRSGLQSKRKNYMKQMYEVLKFIEHGDNCRKSTDCVSGMNLLDYLRENPVLDRGILSGWLHALAKSADCFHRAESGRNYKYLNPCSVIVNEEKKLYLLDLESHDNMPVLKKMQKGAVREHFVRPLYEKGVNKNNEADLFAYGKTVQFILAYADVHPYLTRYEELRLEKVIRRCTGETRKSYRDFREVMRELPLLRSRGERKGLCGKKIVRGAAGGLVLCLVLLIPLGLGKRGVEETSHIYKKSQKENEHLRQEFLQMLNEEKMEFRVRDLAEKVKNAAEKGAEAAREMYLESELLNVYDGFLQTETDPGKVEEISLKKMEIEAQNGDYDLAVQTGEAAMQKIPESREVQEMITVYKKNGGTS